MIFRLWILVLPLISGYPVWVDFFLSHLDVPQGSNLFRQGVAGAHTTRVFLTPLPVPCYLDDYALIFSAPSMPCSLDRPPKVFCGRPHYRLQFSQLPHPFFGVTSGLFTSQQSLLWEHRFHSLFSFRFDRRSRMIFRTDSIFLCIVLLLAFCALLTETNSPLYYLVVCGDFFSPSGGPLGLCLSF